jgi:hypothetical protein
MTKGSMSSLFQLGLEGRVYVEGLEKEKENGGISGLRRGIRVAGDHTSLSVCATESRAARGMSRR